MHEPEFTFPDDLMETATAIAERETKNMDVYLRSSAAMEGETYSPQHDVARKQRMIGQMAMYVLRIENPDAPVSINEVVDALAIDDQIAEVMHGVNLEIIKEHGPHDQDELLTTDNLKNMLTGLSAEHTQVLKSGGYSNALDFRRVYEMARQFAEDRGTSVANVYADDGLYNELRRTAQTPDQFASDCVLSLESFSADTLKAAVVRQLRQVLPPAWLEDMSEDEINEMVMEMQLDKDLHNGIEQDIEPAREALRQAHTYNFIKIYGYDRLSGLDGEVLQKLLPKQPWIKELFEEDAS
jgi:hypothetical protein